MTPILAVIAPPSGSGQGFAVAFLGWLRDVPLYEARTRVARSRSHSELGSRPTRKWPRLCGPRQSLQLQVPQCIQTSQAERENWASLPRVAPILIDGAWPASPLNSQRIIYL